MTEAGYMLSPARSGVYRAPEAVPRLRQEAAKRKFTWINLDLRRVTGKQQFLARCAAALGFPETFGSNWDALADCLQDLSWRRAAGYVLHMRGGSGFARAAPEDYATALEILRDAATFWRERGKAFVVLVEGASDLAVFPS